MGRKTKKTDFDLTRPSVGGNEPHFSGIWGVYKSYEIDLLEGRPPFLIAVSELEEEYRPLVDTPHLFFDFAQLVEDPEKLLPKEVVLDWVRKYGVLGLHYGEGILSNREISYRPVLPPLMYDWEGGPEEAVVDFVRAAQEARRVLSLYEAALNKDAESLERLLGGPEVAEKFRTFHQVGTIMIGGKLVSFPVNQQLTMTEILVDKALFNVWGVVQDKLSNFAYPAINHESPNSSALPHFHRGDLFAPDRLATAWGFRNLLGAMYLQFYWLITSRADLKHCKYCGHFLPLAPPVSQGGEKKRKPRNDKEYCDKSCQQNYDYHKRRKHKRKGEEA